MSTGADRDDADPSDSDPHDARLHHADPHADADDVRVNHMSPAHVEGDQVFGMYEARAQFSRLVQRAAEGERIVIARSGHPVARLSPVLAPGETLSGPALAHVYARPTEIQAALRTRQAGGGTAPSEDDDAERPRTHRGDSPGRRGRLVAARVAVAMSDPSGTAC